MLRVPCSFRLKKPFNGPSNFPYKRWVQLFSKRKLRHAAHVMGPTLAALVFTGISSSVAHAQGTMDFSGATTLMSTFNSRFAYVSVSRASHDAQIYTNDATNLSESLSRDVSKTSAIELRKNQTTVASVGLEQARAIKQSSGIGLGLSF